MQQVLQRNLQVNSGAFLKRTIDPPHWPGSGPAVEPLLLRKAPLLAAALAFSLGSLLARPADAWRPAVVLLAWTILLAAAAMLARRSIAWIAATALWVVAGFWSAEIQPGPSSQTELVHFADGLQRVVQGRVIRVRALSAGPIDTGDGEAGDGEVDATGELVDLSVDNVEEITPDLSTLVPIHGGVRVRLPGGSAPLQCGDAVQTTLRLRVPQRYRDPGAWEYADYLAAQGIGATAISAAKFQILAGGKRNRTLGCELSTAQHWASSRIDGYVASPANASLPAILRLSADDAGMLDAMLFGDRDRLNHTLRLGFERTGSFHLFVVSGMHVALLAGTIFYLCRRLRMPQTAGTACTMLATLLYALLTGFGAPVQRALLMSCVFLVARWLHRERNVMNSLGAAALAVLILSPMALFEPSFQMTFLVIVAIGGIAVPLGEWSFLRYARATHRLDEVWLDPGMHPRLAEFRVQLRLWGEHLVPVFGPAGFTFPALLVRSLLWFAELVLVGVVAETMMVLPMAAYFHRATVFALPANVFSLPLAGLLAPAAVLTFLSSLVSLWIAMIPAVITALLLHGTTGVIAWMSHLRMADLRVPGPASWVFAVAVVCWLALCWLVRRSRGGAVLTALLLPVIAAAVLWPEPPCFTPDALELTAIDVGQGDSLLLVSPEGKTMLIDAGGPVGRGENAPMHANFDIGEDVVSPYLWSRRMRRLDVVVLTHAHSDHMGGMAAVLRNFRPRELWVSVDPRSESYAALMREAGDLGVVVRHMHAGEMRAFGAVRFTALAPALDYANRGTPINDDSLVLRADYGGASVLLEGDAEVSSERAMLETGRIRPVTLLKVGHHGSRTSSTREFLDAARPQMAVISVGRNNTFGHPRPEVIAHMAEEHIRLYRTDRFGLTQFLLTSDGRIREIVSEP